MADHFQPFHSLDDVRRLVMSGRISVKDVARTTTWEDFGMGQNGIEDALLSLDPSDFHKSMDDDKFAGQRLDVYKTVYAGFPMYIKLKIVTFRGERVMVLSFKDRYKQR
jgi:hypothetical protein